MTTIKCDICNKTYKTNITFQNHTKLNRCKVQDILLNCSLCNKLFSDKYTRVRHEKTCGTKPETKNKNQIKELKELVLQLNTKINELLVYKNI